MKTPTLSVMGAVSFPLLFTPFVTQEQEQDSDSSMTTTAIILRVLLCLFRILPRFLYQYRRMRRLVVRRLVYLCTYRRSLAVPSIPFNEILVVVLPVVTISQFMDAIVNCLARRRIEATGIVTHYGVLAWSPNARPIG